MVTKLLTPPLEGGVDGDGLPANFNLEVRKNEFRLFIKTHPWDGKL